MSNGDNVPFFSPRQGARAMQSAGETALVLAGIILGILLHFLYEILVAAAKSNSDPDFGGKVQIAVRLGLAFIVGLVSFVGIYRQLEQADRGIRFFLALTQGFALDALTMPLGEASAPQDMTSGHAS